MTRQARRRVEEQYARHSLRAIRLAFLLTGDSALAEDLAQDAFVRTLGRVPSVKDDIAFQRYMSRVIINLSKDHFRAATRKRDLERRVESDAARSTSSPDPEEEVAVLDLLGRLPARQRAALVLRFYWRESFAEIGETLGISPDAAKKLVRRGLDRAGITLQGGTDE